MDRSVSKRNSKFEYFCHFFRYFLIFQSISICALFSFFAPTAANEKNLRCYAICVAKCIKQQAQTLDVCDSRCQTYAKDEKLCADIDVACWDRCRNLTLENGAKPDIPTGLSYIYEDIREGLAQLQWKHAKDDVLYLVQYAESEGEYKESADTTPKSSGLLMSTNSSVALQKKNVCSLYEYKVAAANEFGFSNFSSVAEIPAPIPTVQNISFEIIGAKVVDKPFYDKNFGRLDNRSVELTVRFEPPIGWNLSSNDYSPVFTSFIQHCNKGILHEMEEVAPTLGNDPTATFHFPVSFIHHECNVLVELTKLVSKCDTEFSYNSQKSESTFVFFQFNCTSVVGSGCNGSEPKRPRYECSVDNMDASYNASNAWLHVKWSATSKKSDDLRPDYYDYIIVQVDLPFANIFSPPINARLILNDSIAVENKTIGVVDFYIPFNVSTDHAYYMQICEGYSGYRQEHRDWRTANKFQININDAFAKLGRSTADSAGGQNAGSLVPLILGSLASALLGFLVVILVWWKWKRGRKGDKPKSIGQLGAGSNNIENDSRYVLPPRRFDQWELPRKRLHVYEDQKLGSGAFGAVFKGKVTGKLLTHAKANSVLAENWMKSENCIVAVKMLPSYADEMSKSEFMKEIGLMKNLGYHERLVNMLACVTADEPLCLIVEYCSEGDLLYYLRTRRKYMIKLEEANVDINEADDVDMNMILCLKDLISFAWQISTGMEYLTQKGLIHRDLAARNILVDSGKKAKIGDFGLCRYSNSDSVYVSKGGRLPLKWIAIEAIKTYEFTVKSDVWSFGVLLFEIITLGGTPYPGVQPADMEVLLDSGQRMDQPEHCSDELYSIMLNTWEADPAKRCSFDQISAKLRNILESLTEDYMYMSLNKKCPYYNVGKENNDATNSLSLLDQQNSSNRTKDAQNLNFSANQIGKGFANPSFKIDERHRITDHDENLLNDEREFVEVELDSKPNSFRESGKLDEIVKFFKNYSPRQSLNAAKMSNNRSDECAARNLSEKHLIS